MIGLTPEQFAQILATAAGNGGGGLTTQALDAVMARARKPIPEVEIHSGVSHYRPLDPETGRGTEVEGFKWPEVWYAIRDEKGDFHPNKPFEWERCTVEEIRAINSLVPVRGKVPFTDGSLQDVQVVEERTIGGQAKRLLIAFDAIVFNDKQLRNQIGPIPTLCRNLLELAKVAA